MSGPTLPRRFAGRPMADGQTAAPGVVQGLSQASATRVRAGRLWLVQVVTGGALVGFLGLHLVAQHFLAPGGLRDFSSVVDYLRQPMAILAELGLVVSVVVHASLGVRTFFVELVHDLRARRLATILIALVATGIVLYAVWLTYRLASWQS
jgi:succinate dehydrogenase hydrophobic anchor subunit